jgi:UrcA family protein
MSQKAKLAFLMLAGTVGCAMGAGAANAAAVDEAVPSIVVRYSRDSLAHQDGVRDLYRRIVIAARQVCPADESRELAANARVAACRQQAVSRAIQQIHNSQLAALHATGGKNS